MPKLKTWHYEQVFCALVLGACAYLTSNSVVNWLSAVGVLCALAKASIADRMNEHQKLQVKPSVTCFRWNLGYTIGGEVCWSLVFLLTRTYPALVGVALMLLYPVWRRVWRHFHPMSH